LSAVLHLAAVALLVFEMHGVSAPAELETAIPVALVRLPEPAPPPEPARPDPAIRPEIAEPPPEPPLRPRQALEEIRPDAPEQDGIAAPQEAKRPDEPADGVAMSDEKAAVLGRWRLDPLTLRQTGHPCGDASESGTLDLIGERGPGEYHGTLKTHVQWTRCPPQAATYYVELRIKDGTAVMVGSGFADRGTVDGDVMKLRDAYGVSVWRRQPVAPAAPGRRQ
jgi:hypothetical protein